MKHRFLLIILLLAVGCSPEQGKRPQHPEKSATVSQPIQGASISGGDGTSIEQAVIIKTSNSLLGIRAEYRWIKQNHPDWQLKEQSVLKGGGKVYDKMYFRTPDGKLAILYFDVTDFYGKK